VDADLLLRWMSETGAGSIRDLRERAAWLARAGGRPTTRTATGRWVKDLTSLAHTEVDWDEDRWAVTPSTVVRLPAADGTAILVGSRRAGHVEAIQDEMAVTLVSPQPAPGDLPTPTVVLVQFDSVEQIKAAAAAAGAIYVGCAAAQLAAVLTGPGPGAPAAPPTHREETLERLAARSGLPFERASGDADGLYRLRRHGRWVYLYRSGGEWWRCDLATGVFRDLARNGESVMRWRAEPGAGRASVGTMFIDWGAPLPVLHARTLVLCSGFPPTFSGAARTAIYVNVPIMVAQAVARSLRQELHLL
jgi:hypothetical protein